MSKPKLVSADTFKEEGEIWITNTGDLVRIFFRNKGKDVWAFSLDRTDEVKDRLGGGSFRCGGELAPWTGATLLRKVAGSVKELSKHIHIEDETVTALSILRSIETLLEHEPKQPSNSITAKKKKKVGLLEEQGYVVGNYVTINSNNQSIYYVDGAEPEIKAVDYDYESIRFDDKDGDSEWHSIGSSWFTVNELDTPKKENEVPHAEGVLDTIRVLLDTYKEKNADET